MNIKQIKYSTLLKTTLAAMMLSGIVLADNGISSAQAKIVIYSGVRASPRTEFIERLQKNILNGEKQQVAEVISYPLPVKLSGKEVKIQNQQQFLQHYNELITLEMIQALKVSDIKETETNHDGITKLGNDKHGIFIGFSCGNAECLFGKFSIMAINNKSVK